MEWTEERKEYRRKRQEEREQKTRDFEEFKKKYPIKEETPWTYDIRSFLCDKHRAWKDKQRESWRHGGGNGRRGYAERRRADYRFYRAEVKNIVRSRDWEDVDTEIPPYRKNWLD